MSLGLIESRGGTGELHHWSLGFFWTSSRYFGARSVAWPSEFYHFLVGVPPKNIEVMKGWWTERWNMNVWQSVVYRFCIGFVVLIDDGECCGRLFFFANKTKQSVPPRSSGLDMTTSPNLISHGWEKLPPGRLIVYLECRTPPRWVSTGSVFLADLWEHWQHLSEHLIFQQSLTWLNHFSIQSLGSPKMGRLKFWYVL